MREEGHIASREPAPGDQRGSRGEADTRYARDPAYGNPPQWTRLYDKFFPVHTDPWSRHAKLIADQILRDPKSEVRRLLIDNHYEPDHWASAIEVSVQGLWKTRAANAREVLDRIKPSFFDAVLDNVVEEHREEVLYALQLALAHVTARPAPLLRAPLNASLSSREDQ